MIHVAAIADIRALGYDGSALVRVTHDQLAKRDNKPW
jgi:hypothetical protein